VIIAQHNRHWSADCNHGLAVVTRYHLIDSITQKRNYRFYHVWVQCMRCGMKLAVMKKADIKETAKLPEFNYALREKVQNDRFESTLRAPRMSEYYEEGESYKDRYLRYMNSPAWAKKRGMVLKRANHVCEGCASDVAVQVHHLTYARIEKEMLFDLVALCRRCHERIHDISPPADPYHDEET